MIYIIEDNEIMSECIASACQPSGTRIFADAISALNAIAENIPDLIFLDILLTGPNGFTLLNELVSYEDTAKIPVVIITSLKLEDKNLDSYGVVEILSKDTFTPQDIKHCIEKYTPKKEGEDE